MENSAVVLNGVNDETYYMIDIDGVILDTEERIAMVAALVGWKEAFKIINWHEHIYSSKQINGSLDILREVQQYLLRLQLVTLNHTEEEEKEKICYLRENGIYVPIVSVPKKMSKSFVVPPSFYNGNVVLVDDKLKNCLEWESAGGIGVYFTQDGREVPLQKVKNLDFLKKVK